jgi:hypothetical protein
MVAKRATSTDYHLSINGVHLNRDGHRLLAQVIHQALLSKPLPGLPEDLVKKYQSKQNLLSPAWLTHTAHTRPGVKPGLSLEEAKQKAAAIQ